MSRTLVKEASAILASNDSWDAFLQECEDIITDVNDWRSDLMKSQTQLDILSGKILDFTELMDALDRIKTIARFMARAMEHRFKKAKGQAIHNAVEEKKTVTYAQNVSKYLNTDEAQNQYNESQLVADRLQGSWDVAKETISSARSKLSYEKEVVRNLN